MGKNRDVISAIGEYKMPISDVRNLFAEDCRLEYAEKFDTSETEDFTRVFAESDEATRLPRLNTSNG